MPTEVLLTLHCPECRQLVEVVADGEHLICLECGWKFDDKVAAKFLNRNPVGELPVAASPAP